MSWMTEFWESLAKALQRSHLKYDLPNGQGEFDVGTKWHVVFHVVGNLANILQGPPNWGQCWDHAEFDSFLWVDPLS